MKQTFTYKKASVLLGVSLPVIMLAFIVFLPVFTIYEEFSRGRPIGAGLIIIFVALLLFFCGVVFKIADIIKTAITLDDRGISYNSIIKKIVIPWQDIVQIRRVDLTTMEKLRYPPPPKDLKIQTKNYGNLFVFHFLRLKDQDSDCDEMTRLIAEYSKKAQWSYASDDWKSELNTRRQKGRIIIGILLVLFGCLVPLLSARMQQKSPGLDLIISNLGVPGTTIFIIAVGLYTVFLDKGKNIK